MFIKIDHVERKVPKYENHKLRERMASLESLLKVAPGGCERDGWREIM